MTKKEIIFYFENHNSLNKEQKLYLTIHARRFETILDLIADKENIQVLDIGPSFLSELLYLKFGNQLKLMGFKSDDSFGGHLPNHTILSKLELIEQDLNFWQAEALPSTVKFDLIICAEVLEHLYTSPNVLFKNLHQSLNKNGILIIQTPNAAALRKRLALIGGKNPFEIPRENLKNPGHFREYTYQELINLGNQNNFKISKLILDEYFEYPSSLSKLYRTFKNLIPKSLKSGITIVYHKA